MAIDNSSSILLNITFETEEKLSTFEIRADDIVKIAGSSDPSKAQGHNEISIHTIKICVSSISKQLATFLGNSFENKCFP